MNLALQTRFWGANVHAPAYSMQNRARRETNDLLSSAWTDYSSPVRNTGPKSPSTGDVVY